MLGFATYTSTGDNLEGGPTHPIIWTPQMVSFSYLDVTDIYWENYPAGALTMVRFSVNMPGPVSNSAIIKQFLLVTDNDGASQYSSLVEWGFLDLENGSSDIPTSAGVNVSALTVVTAIPTPSRCAFTIDFSNIDVSDMVAGLEFMSWTTP